MISSLKQHHLSDIDRDIYDLIAACGQLGIPLSFESVSTEDKLMFLASLNRLLKQHGAEPAAILGARSTFTVSIDEA